MGIDLNEITKQVEGVEPVKKREEKNKVKFYIIFFRDKNLIPQHMKWINKTTIKNNFDKYINIFIKLLSIKLKT